MDETRAAREVFVPFYGPNLLPETQQELDGLDPSDTSGLLPDRQPGDVLDGSVDSYDFDWGDGTDVPESGIFSGCRRGDTSYTGCDEMPPCEDGDDPDVPCIPDEPDPPDGSCTPGGNLPDPSDDPGYVTVDP